MARMPVMMSLRLFWNRPLVTVAIAPVWGFAVEPMDEDRIARLDSPIEERVKFF